MTAAGARGREFLSHFAKLPPVKTRFRIAAFSGGGRGHSLERVRERDGRREEVVYGAWKVDEEGKEKVAYLLRMRMRGGRDGGGGNRLH